MHELKQSYNSAGEGWVYLTELDVPHNKKDGEGRAVPEVQVQEQLDGVTVIRLSFRDGDVMADHHAPRPILVVGQVGEVRFNVGGENKTIKPGTAIHVRAKEVHALYAENGDAVVSLLLLG